ncbi:hypothetical protein [Candidatus Uabimicrobium sp. HlEnr_7]|uniref:hypothetical protein n=1 Tax=Candidatus Uabimicrobium helgolandensis TaxID=3095367 RepID=UPI0035564987
MKKLKIQRDQLETEVSSLEQQLQSIQEQIDLQNQPPEPTGVEEGPFLEPPINTTPNPTPPVIIPTIPTIPDNPLIFTGGRGEGANIFGYN